MKLKQIKLPGTLHIVKWSTHQEDIAILHAHAPKPRTAKYVKQKWVELKGEVNKSTVIVEDFDTPFSVIDRTIRQEISKDTENSTIPLTHRLELMFIEYSTTTSRISIFLKDLQNAYQNRLYSGQ